MSGEIEHIEYTVHGLRKNGTTIVMESAASAHNNGRPAVFGTVLDMTARKQWRMALEAAALLDPLTGFYNRRGFLTVTSRQLLVARRKKQSLILIAADVDDLKTSTTRLDMPRRRGAVAAAKVLRHSYREADVVARLGGDEFVVFPLDASVNSVPLLLQRLEDNLQVWRKQHPSPYVLSISTGSAVLDPTDESVTIEELLAQADSDLYRHKRARSSTKTSRMMPFWGGDAE